MRIGLLSPRNSALINAALAAGLLAALLLLARDAIRLALDGTENGQTVQAGTALPGPGQASLPLERYAPLVGAGNMFGFPPAKLHALSGGAGEEPAASKADRADIKLFGAVAWPGGQGYAVLSGKSGQELYKTGDDIPGYGTLKSVGAESVTVESGGGEFVVSLEPVGGVKVEVLDRAPNPAGFARKSSDDTYIIDRTAVEESLANPKRMLTDARLLPNLVDGRQEGFVMSEVRPGGLYQTLGLRNGDVLLKVNGFDISSAESGLQAFTALRGMEKIELDILRGGSPLSLTYLIR